MHTPTQRLLAPILLCLTALPLIAQTLPQPLPLEIPDAPAGVVVQKNGQIEKISHKKEDCLAPLKLPEPLGGNYTLTFWIKLDDTPALTTAEFTADAPITLIDLSSPKWDDQRTTLRIQGGRLTATALNNGKWARLSGLYPIIKPGVWYFLAYVKSGGSGVFYMDGDIISRTPKGAPVQDRIQNIIFGNFQKQRRLEGVILQPRLYPAALDTALIETLFTSRPDEAR